jgi:parallel beta-helix repeat protein
MRKLFIIRFACAITACLTALTGISAAPKIDPIKFSITTSTTQINLNEEFEIKITAEFMSIPANTVFILQGSNSFKLKVILPDGFVKTGGDYFDFIGTELNQNRRKVTYSLKGKFTSSETNGVFQLLRSHKNADSQSMFIEAGRLTFAGIKRSTQDSKDEEARLAGTPGYVPFMNMTNLRAGNVDTARVVQIVEGRRSGKFVYDPADLTSPDDSAMTLVWSSKRYKRQYQEHINPAWFGAVGDSTVDDTQNFKKAILYAKNKKKSLILETGSNYLITSDIDVYCNIEGFGKIKTRNFAHVVLLTVGMTVRDITIDGRNWSTGGGAISGSGIQVKSVTVNIDNVKISGVINQGIWAQLSNRSKITNCIIKEISGDSGDGIYFATSSDVLVQGNTISKHQRAGITFEAGGAQPSYRPIIVNNWIKDVVEGTEQRSGGVHLEQCMGGIIEGNRIENCIDRSIVVNPIISDGKSYDYIIANNSVQNCERGISVIGGADIHNVNISDNTIIDCLYSIEIGAFKEVKITDCTFGLSTISESVASSLVVITPIITPGKKSTIFIDGCISSRTLNTNTPAIFFGNTANFNCDFTVQNCVGNFSVRQYLNYITGSALYDNVTMDYSNFDGTSWPFGNFLQNTYKNCTLKFVSTNNFTLARPVTFERCKITADTLTKLSVGIYGSTSITFDQCNIQDVVVHDIRRTDFPTSVIIKGNTIADYGPGGFLDGTLTSLKYFSLSDNKFTSNGSPTVTPIQLPLANLDSDIGVNSYKSTRVTNVPNPKTTVPWEFTIATTTTAPTKAYLNANYGKLKSGSVITFSAITGGAHDYKKLTDDSTSDWVDTLWSTGGKMLTP